MLQTATFHAIVQDASYHIVPVSAAHGLDKSSSAWLHSPGQPMAYSVQGRHVMRTPARLVQKHVDHRTWLQSRLRWRQCDLVHDMQ